MPWTLDRNNVTPAPGWDPNGANKVSQDHLNEFMNKVAAGDHPRTAASGWDSHYTIFKGTDGQGEIRLNGKDRATFSVDEVDKLCTMLAVGGHS